MVPYEKDLVAAFQSQRLVFRALEDNEVDRTFAANLYNDPVNEAMNIGRPIQPLRVDEIEGLVNRSKSSLMMVVACLKDEEEVGSTSSGHRGPTSDHKMATDPTAIGVLRLYDSGGGLSIAYHRNATLGVSVAELHRGKGYGGEMVNWALDWAFRRRNLHRIQLDCFSYNVNALKLYRKLGFVEEGRKREAVYYDRGWHDEISFGMLEHEWKTLRNL